MLYHHKNGNTYLIKRKFENFLLPKSLRQVNIFQLIDSKYQKIGSTFPDIFQKNGEVNIDRMIDHVHWGNNRDQERKIANDKFFANLKKR